MAWTRPLVIPAWAHSGDKVAPTDAEVEVGWPVTTIPPSRQRFNWFFNVVHAGVLYLARRGLTDWVATDTFEIGDRTISPVDGKTYRSLVTANINFEPSANPTKWERWGWTEKELAEYLRSKILSPVRCPVTGPAANPSDASPYTVWQSVAPYNEYWRWTGDAWKVHANLYALNNGAASSTLTANVVKSILSITAPRNGNAMLRSILSHANSTNTRSVMSSYVTRTRAGVTTTVEDMLAVHTTDQGTQYSQCRAVSNKDVQAGDVFTLMALCDKNMDPSPTNASTIYMEYRT